MSRFRFVADHRDAYGAKRLCEVLNLNRSSYCKWLAGREARTSRHREDRLLAERIREVHRDSGGAYGSPRVIAELRAKGLRANEKRVARVMRTFFITGARECSRLVQEQRLTGTELREGDEAVRSEIARRSD